MAKRRKRQIRKSQRTGTISPREAREAVREVIKSKKQHRKASAESAPRLRRPA